MSCRQHRRTAAYLGQYTRDNAGPAGSRRTEFDFPPIDRERAYRCIDAMKQIGDAKGISVARVALAYVLQKRFVMSVIIGAKTLEQLDDTIAATGVAFSAEELHTLDEVSALPPEYPGWMISRQMVGRVPAACGGAGQGIGVERDGPERRKLSAKI